jgi:hypothetical protein
VGAVGGFRAVVLGCWAGVQVSSLGCEVRVWKNSVGVGVASIHGYKGTSLEGRGRRGDLRIYLGTRRVRLWRWGLSGAERDQNN